MRGIINKIILVIVISIMLGICFFISYPLLYVDIIEDKSEKYGVDPFLIASIINVESHYKKDAKSSKEAKGLMQITPKTGQWASEIIGITNYEDKRLYEADVNIEIGTWYIDRLMDQFNGNLNLALAAYNGGSGNVEKWLDEEEYSDGKGNLRYIPFEETRNYVEKVRKNYNIYSRIYSFKFK